MDCNVLFIWRICFHLQRTSVFSILLIFNRHLNSVRFCIFLLLFEYGRRATCNHTWNMPCMKHSWCCKRPSAMCFSRIQNLVCVFVFIFSPQSIQCSLFMQTETGAVSHCTYIFWFRKVDERRWENCSNFAERKCNHFFDDCTVCRAMHI